MEFGTLTYSEFLGSFPLTFFSCLFSYLFTQPRQNNTIDTILAKNPILTWIFVDRSIIAQGILRIVIGEWIALSFAKMPSLVRRSRCDETDETHETRSSTIHLITFRVWLLWSRWGRWINGVLILWILWILWSRWIYQFGIPLITRNLTYNRGWAI